MKYGAAGLGGLLLSVCSLQAAEMLCDFETEEDVRRYAVASLAGRYMGVTNAFATSGSHSLLFAFEPWLKGDWKYGAYESIRVPVPASLSDWRAFDRLSFDLVSEKEGGDTCLVYVDDKNGNSEIVNHFSLPGRTVTRHVVPIDPRTRRKVQFAKVDSIAVTVRMPRGCWLHVDNFRLYRPGEELPPLDVGEQGRETVRYMGRLMSEAQERAREAETRAAHLESLFKFRAACTRARTSRNGMAIGKASSMTMVRPRAVFAAEPADRFELSLARNESESVQVLVAPTAGDLRNVRVSVSDLVCGAATFPAADIRCAPIGYVNAKTPGYRADGKVPEPGWYPDTILAFLKGVDVKGTDVQGFWVRVTCPERRAAGRYVGKLTVAADNAKPVEIPFAVRVRNFAVGRVSPLHLELSFRPKAELDEDRLAEATLTANPKWPGNLWKRHEDEWTDFLADYYISPVDLYMEKGDELNLRQLRRLKAQGRLGDVCLGYWNPIWADGEDIVRRFERGIVEPIRERYELAKREGLLCNPFVYGADEYPSKEATIRRMKKSLELLRAAVPGVRVTTTGFIRGTNRMFDPHGFGLGVPEMDGVDMFIPTIGAYSVAMVEHGTNWVEKARKAGKKVGWYICNNPDHPFAQMFLEVPPIESRLLMGAMAEKCRTDGFLIWSIAAWNCDHCITSGPFTDWNPRTFLTDNSDAQWVCPGPDGTPLATIRLENFRDGLEDLWYVRLYEKKFGRRPEVPEALVSDLRNYSRDPVTLQAWRDGLAEALEK